MIDALDACAASTGDSNAAGVEPTLADAISIIDAPEAIARTFAVMRQLRPDLNRDTYVSEVELLHAEVGYRLAMLTIEGNVVCVAGFRFCRSLGWGKYHIC